MDQKKAEDILRQVEELQSKRELCILKISEPISSAISTSRQRDDGAEKDNSALRASDVSTSSLDAPTPASLEADLAHYRELFAKLRFSYVEQVTKEKFIRAIVGDPPLIVTPRENADLEQLNAAAKARLKARKTEVAAAVEALETRGRELARRYESVQRDTALLRETPGRIAELEARNAELRAAVAPDSQGGEADGDWRLRLPLSRTLELVAARKDQQRELDRQLEQLRAQVPRKRKEAVRLQAELAPLEVKRQNSTAAAHEARRRKEAALGGVQDDLEERGRWWRGSEMLLKQMLEI